MTTPSHRRDRPQSSLAVDVTSLSKRYGRRTVVSSLDLRVPYGSVTGLVGPNGAGKTTVMAMLLGLVRPSTGDGTVLGEPLDQPARFVGRAGAVIELPAFHLGLTALENLLHLVALGDHDASRVPDLLDLVGLRGRERDKVRVYSLGMTQRLGIAAALLADPELLVLDEPANGLDPVGIRELRRMIRTISDHGTTVLVSSHLLLELERVCDHLIVIDQGKSHFQGPIDDLPRPVHGASDLESRYLSLIGYDVTDVAS